MSGLDKFSDSERELLASLPYKTGIWMGYAEDHDGEGDDERETGALEDRLRRFARRHADKSFLALLLNETLARQDKWAEWADQSFHTLDEIKKGVALLRHHVSADELRLFKRALMEIATAVAQASGEFEEVAEKEGFFSKIIGKFAGGRDAGDAMNVSATEDSALEKLRRVLQNKG